MTDPPPSAQDDFSRLFREVHRDLVRFCARRVDPSTAEDVAASALLTAWRRWADAPAGTDAQRAWVHGIARHQLLSSGRSAGRQAALAVRIGAADPPAQDDAETVALSVDLAAAWGRLTPDQQETLALTAWDGLTSTQAGQVLGISPVAYRLRLARARAALRAHLDLVAPTRRGPTAPTCPGARS